MEKAECGKVNLKGGVFDGPGKVGAEVVEGERRGGERGKAVV